MKTRVPIEFAQRLCQISDIFKASVPHIRLLNGHVLILIAG